MENEINLTKAQINSLLISYLKGEGENSDSEKVKNSLSAEQREKLERVMSDPNKIKAVLATDQAKKLLEMLRGKRE